MKSWKKLNSQIAFNCPYLKVLKNQYDTGEGLTIDDYYLVERSDYVVIVAKFQEKFVVVSQYRPGPNKIIYDFSAGWLDPGEEAIQAAKRELAEETGYVGEAQYLGKLMTEPSFLTSTAHIVFIKAFKRQVTHFEKDEVIETQLMSELELKRLITTGQFFNAVALAAFQLYLNK